MKIPALLFVALFVLSGCETTARVASRSAPLGAFARPPRIVLEFDPRLAVVIRRHPEDPTEKVLVIRAFAASYLRKLQSELAGVAEVRLGGPRDSEALTIVARPATLDPGFLDVQNAVGRGVYQARYLPSRVQLDVIVIAPNGRGQEMMRVSHLTKPTASPRIPIQNDAEELAITVASDVKALLAER